MKLLVTGGTGFIGRHFIQRRLLQGDEVVCLSRQPQKVAQLFGDQVDPITVLPKDGSLQVDAVVNLAGEPIADKRWSEAQKHRLRDSRILLTLQLVEWISEAEHKPHTFISGSAIGFYGAQADDRLLSEESEFKTGFTHQLCADWEKAALQAESLGVRVCLLRTGIVLGDGGALQKMLLPFKLCLGGPIANGQQVMSWIHLDDEVEIIEMLLTHEHLTGAFNLTAPEAVSNAEFSKTLGRVLKRPACLPLPSLVPKLMLGEGAELLLEGQRVYPQKLLDAGFKFQYPELEPALRQILA